MPYTFSQRKQQLEAPPAAPMYTPGLPAPREVAYTPTPQSGFHQSLFPDVGTYSTGSGTGTPTPNASQRLLPQVNTNNPSSVLPPKQTSGTGMTKNPPLQTRGIPLAEPNSPSKLESTVNGILPSPQSLMSPMVYERSNIYGNKGITRFDDASGVPTFTNTGRAGYDALKQGGGGLSIVPAFTPEQAASQSAANAGLHKARMAASMGLSEERYDRVMAARQQDREIAALGRQGFSTKDVAGLMKGALPDAKAGVYAAQTQKELALAQKAQAEAQGTDPKTGYYGSRANKEDALAQGAMLDNQAKQTLAQIQQQLLTETDPLKRKHLMEMALTFQGKVAQQQPRFRAFSVPGGKNDLGEQQPGQVYMYDQYEGPISGALPGPPHAQARQALATGKISLQEVNRRLQAAGISPLQ